MHGCGREDRASVAREPASDCERRGRKAFFTARVTDAHGQPVAVDVFAFGPRTHDGRVGGGGRIATFCGETPKPISFPSRVLQIVAYSGQPEERLPAELVASVAWADAIASPSFDGLATDRSARRFPRLAAIFAAM